LALTKVCPLSCEKAFYWKRSRIALLEVKAIPQSCIPSPDWFEYCFMYEKFVSLESCGLHPSSQYILMRVPFRENVLVPGKSPVKVQPEILDIFFLVELHVV
jgi:hypothetical protein